MMQSDQYEELCRYFIADRTGLPLEAIQSTTIPNAQRPGLPAYRHQIDLYWETGDEIALYLNIANAKWRGSAPVDQGEVLLLQQVRQDVAAHKALMITNVGFTSGAVAAAKHHGIALHVLVPEFDTAKLPQGNRRAILGALQTLAADQTTPLYSYRVEYRAFDLGVQSTTPDRAPNLVRPQGPSGYSTRVVQVTPRGIPGAQTGRPTGGGESPGGPGPGPSAREGGDFSKR